MRVVADQVFVEGLPLEELKGRRALAIQHMHRRVTAAPPATAPSGDGPSALSPEEKAGFAARKHDLLGREETLENEWARERQKKENPRKAAKKAQRTRVSCCCVVCRVAQLKVVFFRRQGKRRRGWAEAIPGALAHELLVDAVDVRGPDHGLLCAERSPCREADRERAQGQCGHALPAPSHRRSRRHAGRR